MGSHGKTGEKRGCILRRDLVTQKYIVGNQAKYEAFLPVRIHSNRLYSGVDTLTDCIYTG